MITINLEYERGAVTVQLDAPARPQESAQAIKEFFLALNGGPATAPQGQ